VEVGIISTELMGLSEWPDFKPTYECAHLRKELEQLNCGVVLIDPTRIVFDVRTDGFDIRYLGHDVSPTLFNDLDALVVKRTRGMAEEMLDIVDAVDTFHPEISMFDPALSFRRPLSKIESYIRRSGIGIPHLPTFIGLGPGLRSEDVRLPLPLLDKPTIGARGVGIREVKTKHDLAQRIAELHPDHAVARGQGYGICLQQRVAIKAEYRVFVISGVPVSIARRQREDVSSPVPGTDLGEAHLEECRQDEGLDEVQMLAVRAASAHGYSFSGVDVIRTDDGLFVLECNRNPQFTKLEQATGDNIAAAMAKHIVDASLVTAA